MPSFEVDRNVCTGFRQRDRDRCTIPLLAPVTTAFLPPSVFIIYYLAHGIFRGLHWLVCRYDAPTLAATELFVWSFAEH
jgi:hypothetical protein